MNAQFFYDLNYPRKKNNCTCRFIHISIADESNNDAIKSIFQSANIPSKQKRPMEIWKCQNQTIELPK